MLSGDYKEESKTAPVEELVEYSGQVFSENSVEDKRPVVEFRIIWSFQSPAMRWISPFEDSEMLRQDMMDE